MGYNDGRKQLERILKLASLLQKSRLRVRDLAERFGVHFTRIYADLKILEKFFVVKKERACYWIEDKRPLPHPKITKQEFNALTAAVDAAKGTLFEKRLKRVIAKLDKPLAAAIRKEIEKEAKISVKLKAGNRHGEVEGYFRTLEKSLHMQKAVRATYQPGGKTETVAHVLHPYAIFFRKEDWYLEARSNLSENASLTFKILRFQQIEMMDESFERPSAFSLAANLASRWELFSGEPVTVHLKIASHKAYLVEEKERHVSQEIVERCADGSVVVRYQVPTEEFTFWVLSLGDAAEVLSPPEFRAEVKEIVRGMHAIYFGDTTE